MFVPRAHVYLGRPVRKGFFHVSSGARVNVPKHDVKCFEFIRMPCLCPTFFGTIIGFIIIFGGVFMCLFGYNPSLIIGNTDDRIGFTNIVNSTQLEQEPFSDKPLYLKILTYVGPVFMGVGFFVLIISIVLYCEIKDKYVTHILPEKDIRNYETDELYDMIIEEFRKNYFRGIEVPLQQRIKYKPKRQMTTLFKALSISTPALLITPEMQRRWQKRDRFMSVSETHSTRSGGSGSERKKRDLWLKTTSLPNIRPKSAMKDFPKTSKKYRYQNLDKSTDVVPANPPMDVDSKTSKTSVETGVDNPAFRESPTAGIQLREIKFTNCRDSIPRPDNTHVTNVLIHDAPKSRFAQRSNSDARGNTLKRQVRINGSVSYHELYSAVEQALQRVDRDHLDTSNKGILQKNYKIHSKTAMNSIDQTSAYVEQYLKQNVNVEPDKNDKKVKSLHNLHETHKTNCKRGSRHDGNSVVHGGHYMTRIGIYKSESDLYTLRHHYVDMNEAETVSDDDSLNLSHETMHNFEMAKISQV